MNNIKEHFSKCICPVSKSETYFFHSETLQSKVKLLYKGDELWTAEIDTMKNVFVDDKNPLGGKWPVKQEAGNSTKEEFEKAYQLAINLAGC